MASLPVGCAASKPLASWAVLVLQPCNSMTTSSLRLPPSALAHLSDAGRQVVHGKHVQVSAALQAGGAAPVCRCAAGSHGGGEGLAQ